jgi:hypothetical protein
MFESARKLAAADRDPRSIVDVPDAAAAPCIVPRTFSMMLMIIELLSD